MTVDYANMTGRQIRALCRSGDFRSTTAGVATAFVQANLVVLHTTEAEHFATFCHRNPQPCPVIAMTEPGRYEPKSIAPCSDIRTDLPRYRVFREDVCVEQPLAIDKYWSDDCVAFLIGCSFTFEAALIKAGIPVRHVEENCNVPMYVTNRACVACGPFSGPLVVSMRPMTRQQADEAERITAQYTQAHGGPIHVGDPAAIGINDLNRPDYGDPVSVGIDEVPVFWACGVTPLEAVRGAKLPFAATHEPGHMFVTDLYHESFRQTG